MEVRLRTRSIRLDALLKFAGVAGTGGMAKILVQSGRVRVNGDLETRRGREIVSGDSVAVLDDRGEIQESLEVRSEADGSEADGSEADGSGSGGSGSGGPSIADSGLGDKNKVGDGASGDANDPNASGEP